MREQSRQAHDEKIRELKAEVTELRRLLWAAIRQQPEHTIHLSEEECAAAASNLNDLQWQRDDATRVLTLKAVRR